MGEKFVNYQVRWVSQHDVAQIVEKITSNQAYISPSKNGWITVYDQTSKEFKHDYIRYFIQELSTKLSTTVFTFMVYRGINFMYLLYNRGGIIDEFDNDTEGETFGDEYARDVYRNRFHGDLNKLLKYCKSSKNLQDISDFLVYCRQRNVKFLGQDAAYNLAYLLGIDTNRATIGYSYFEDNNLYFGTEFYIEEAEQFLLVHHSQK